MNNIEHKIIKPKLGLLELAKQLGSVSQACKVMSLLKRFSDLRRGRFRVAFRMMPSL